MSDFTNEGLTWVVITNGVDPGAVGAGRVWVDTSTEPPTVSVRKQANNGWDAVGSGGGGLPTGWTEDDNNPANVDTNGGNLTLSNDGSIAMSGGGSIENPDGTISGAVMQSLGVTGSAFVVTAGGATAALDCGGLPIKNLPTSDPHIAGALWNDAGTPAISAG